MGVYSTQEQLRTLEAWLNEKGVREKALAVQVGAGCWVSSGISKVSLVSQMRPAGGLWEAK